MKKITILSLDGGGIRGIISCIILRYIEEQLRKQDSTDAKLADYFDLIAGSSTGGLIASILLYPDGIGRPKYSIQKGLELYAEKGEHIFQTSFWEQLVNPFGLFNEKISQQALERNLNDFFGKTELKDLVKPCLITSYDIENRRAKLFNSYQAKTNTDNFLVKDICRATSAAPTYFTPVQIKSMYGQVFSLIDGGMYANNPALCAYAEVRKMPFAEIFNTKQKPNYPSVNDMVIISIGTGAEAKPYSFKSLEKAGRLGWISPIIDILLSANTETVDYQLNQMFQSLGQRNQKNYYRINPSLKNASTNMDNVRKENIEALIQAGLFYVDENKESLNQLVQKLIRNKI
ncbi:patatin-like phospholipase family protein [Chryseobacterium koreense]|uniref:Patatin n=1 Tax=Chryseobacterium koreense CCUG 49689 TaxID=1304281 RepID=A0A0J7LS45_9FLAO|nr:patatin-like phospholipase family protein [Chryseobacterium koreense]KMQ71815.1 patatin [Chryseobacterium koreense CCUG 49689]MBB5334307.1 patatin-like phospholipase/acyl hydrolase [Chryseobacterium koreense]